MADCLSADEVSITSIIANNDNLVYRVRWLPKNLPGKWGDNREYEKCSLAHYFKFVLRCTSVSRTYMQRGPGGEVVDCKSI